MEIAIDKPKEHISVLRLKDRVDASTSAQLEDRVLAALEGQRKACILNLSGVDYLSSAGIRVLITGAKKAHSTGGAFALCALQPSVARLLQMVGFDPLFQAYEDEASAVRAGERICAA